MESKEEQRKREGRERTRRWREQHPEYKEQTRERHKRWYEEHKDEIRAKAREYLRKRYATDPQRVLARHAAWYRRNRESRLEYQRQR